MPDSRPQARARRQFVLGCLLAALPLLGTAEVFLRLFPPHDLYPYLGDVSPLAGIYQPDTDFAATYRSWDDFCADNAERLQPFLPLRSTPSERPLWAFFGNSFIQAPGMLADHARATVHDRRIFNLGRNEDLFVRFAQIKLLMEQGLRPERIFVELMPVDVLTLGDQPLASLAVSPRGALVYRPRMPAGPAGWCIEHSRLALTGWVRSGRQRGNPSFNRNTLYQGVTEPLHSDLQQLFANLARVTRLSAAGIPVTVLLIPAYHQITQGASFGFQDSLTPFLREQGYDIFDSRAVFCAYPDKESLFVPDRHFSPLGNQLLLAELLKHVRKSETLAQAARKAPTP
jgi:hypothetical protein